MPRREIEKNLSRILVQTELNFLPTREISLDEIYSNIELIYPDLCDNNFLCRDCCLSKANAPEWHHIVRSVLSSLKTKGIFENTRRGCWKKKFDLIVPNMKEQSILLVNILKSLKVYLRHNPVN